MGRVETAADRLSPIKSSRVVDLNRESIESSRVVNFSGVGSPRLFKKKKVRNAVW